MTGKELTLNVEKALEEIRPFLQSDGGDISLLFLLRMKNVLKSSYLVLALVVVSIK